MNARQQLPITRNADVVLPMLIAKAGNQAARRFLEFFTVNIRNPNTRAAHGRTAGSFVHWCEDPGIAELSQVQPVHFRGL